MFLAFWLNDYRNSLTEKENARAAIEIVVHEINRNKAILEYWAPRHKEVYDNLMKFAESDNQTLESFQYWEWIDGPIFSDIITYDGWDFIRQVNPKIDYDTRLLINRIYRQQEFVDNSLKSLTNDFLRQRELFDDSKAFENLQLLTIYIGDLWGQEQAMIQQYKRALNQLGMVAH